MDHEQADVWVLTETDDTFIRADPLSYSSAAGRDGESAKEEHWVTLSSQYPLEAIETSDKKRTAAARVRPKGDDPFVVYGTVLPWLGSPWGKYPSAGGVAFRKALSAQVTDWMQIRRDYSDDEFFVIGDLNQDLVNPPHYGSHENRAALEKALKGAGLVALTAGVDDPVRRDSAPNASVDHICARADSNWRAERASRWPDAAEPDKGLSDHYGVSVSLVRR